MIGKKLFVALFALLFAAACPQYGVAIAQAGRAGDLGNAVPTQYASVDDAGIAAEKRYNSSSISLNREFNGNIYSDAQGRCCFIQPPNTGTADSSRPPEPSTLPKGSKRVATYHTHAAYDPNYNNENISLPDKKNADQRGVPIFLGTPNGVIREYDSKTGKTTTFQETTGGNSSTSIPSKGPQGASANGASKAPSGGKSPTSSGADAKSRSTGQQTSFVDEAPAPVGGVSMKSGKIKVIESTEDIGTKFECEDDGPVCHPRK